MNIEITDWYHNPENELLLIYYTTEEGKKGFEVFMGEDDLYDKLVQVGVFEQYFKRFFYHHIETCSDFSGLTEEHKVTTSVDDLWRDFNHLVDTRIMKQLVELKIKKDAKV